LFTEANEEVASDPDFIGGALGAFSENLEFPLTLGNLGIDAFVVDAGVEAEIKVLLDDFASDVANSAEADTSVVRALWGWEAIFRETERASVLIEEILLLESEPSVGIIKNRSTRVGDMRSAIGHHDLAHNESAIFTGRVRENGDWLENAIRAAAGSLTSRAAIKTPQGKFFQLGKICEFLDLSFATEVCYGLIAVEPYVFEFVFSHF
jgi:hypothetical protein